MLTLPRIWRRLSAIASQQIDLPGTSRVSLIIDTSILIQSERRNESAKHILQRIRAACGEVDIGVSVISVMELIHGTFRTKAETDRTRRRIFAEGISRELLAYPVTLEIAQLAGRIEGEQAALG